MAVVLPYPLARRCDLVRRIGSRALAMKPEAGERHISQQVDLQRQTMLRRGVDPSSAELQCHALACAVRLELWRQVMSPGGVA